MTEDEAKTKWCPAYRVATSGGDPSSTYEMDNRPRDSVPTSDAPSAPWLPGPTINPWACCIASSCMAWRWGGYITAEGKEHVVLLEDEIGQPSGFCGLAASQF